MDIREEVNGILGVNECLGTGKYLGLPSMISRKKKAVFNYIKDRMWRRIQSWSGKHLSKAGREVMVKAVAQAIPSYCMSTFLLPVSLAEELQRMINSFWWGSNRGNGKGINWLNWEKLSMRNEFGGMGFRHFYGFNLAMLGKQGWKLTIECDTIVARVFKARYYPREGFLEAKIGHNPSYAWRSIHATQVLVRGGLRWCVGNGRSINVWSDPWLKNPDSSRIQTPPLEGMEEMTVADLIDTDRGEWRITLVQALMQQRDMDEITKILLCKDPGSDSLVWKLSRDGNYSVKSAYFYAMNQLIDNLHLRVEGNWKLLWALNIPPKVKMFIWRLARGCIPTRNKFCLRGVDCPATCAFCEELLENDWHCFVGCSQLVEIWEAAGLWRLIQNNMLTSNGMSQLVFQVLENCSSSQAKDFATMLWLIWWRRNGKIWEGVSRDSQTLLTRAKEVPKDWKGNAQAKLQQQSVSRWKKPPLGLVKCNVDAAIFAAQKQVCIGLCIGDDEGLFVKARTICIRGNLEAIEAEAKGVYAAIVWLVELGYQEGIIESDCKFVMDCIGGNYFPRSELGIILRKYKDTLHTLPNFSLSFVRRQTNFVAHVLARVANSVVCHQDFDYIPNCVQNLIMNESC